MDPHVLLQRSQHMDNTSKEATEQHKVHRCTLVQHRLSGATNQGHACTTQSSIPLGALPALRQSLAAALSVQHAAALQGSACLSSGCLPWRVYLQCCLLLPWLLPAGVQAWPARRPAAHRRNGLPLSCLKSPRCMQFDVSPSCFRFETWVLRSASAESSSCKGESYP